MRMDSPSLLMWIPFSMGGSLNIAQYVSNVAAVEEISFDQVLSQWKASSQQLTDKMNALFGHRDTMTS